MPQIKNALRPDPLLKELHAREESKSSPDTASPDQISQARLASAAEVVLSGGYAVDPAHFGLALQAYQDIRALRLLGLSGLQIARVVRDSRYDKKNNSYPKLHRKVIDAAKDWGVTDEKGLNALLHALLAKDQMDLQVQQARARKIAIETIQVESGELATPVESEVRPHEIWKTI